MNRRRARRVAAFVGAPIVGTIVLVCIQLFTLVSSGVGGLLEPEVWAGFIWIAPYALFIGVAAQTLIGLPLLRAFRSRGWLSSPAFAAGGAAVGLILFLLLYWGDRPFLPRLAFCVLPAVAASVYFGLVGDWTAWSRREPAAASRLRVPAAHASPLCGPYDTAEALVASGEEATMKQREIEKVFEVLGLSGDEGAAAQLKTPRQPQPKRLVFIAAESTSQATETEVHAQLERDSQRAEGGG